MEKKESDGRINLVTAMKNGQWLIVIGTLSIAVKELATMISKGEQLSPAQLELLEQLPRGADEIIALIPANIYDRIRYLGAGDFVYV